MTRRSTRNPQYHPLGPRHLEYDYHVAYEELRAATILAAQALQYPWPRRKGRPAPGKSGKGETAEELMKPTLSTILQAKFPYVEKARNNLNEADRRLQEALNRGETWENTAVPASVLAPTYEALEANMLPPAPTPPVMTRSNSRDTAETTALDTQSSTSTHQTPAPDIQPVPSTNKGLTAHQKATLTYKPKAVIGKRRRIVLSLDVDTDKMSGN